MLLTETSFKPRSRIFIRTPCSLIEHAGQHGFAFGLVSHGQSLKPCCPALAQMTHYADLVQLGCVRRLPYLELFSTRWGLCRRRRNPSLIQVYTQKATLSSRDWVILQSLFSVEYHPKVLDAVEERG